MVNHWDDKVDALTFNQERESYGNINIHRILYPVVTSYNLSNQAKTESTHHVASVLYHKSLK